MNVTPIRRVLVPGVALLAMFATAACGADNEDGGSDGGNADSTGLSGTLAGAGATSQEKAQEAWYTAVQGQNEGNLEITYNAIGSTDGRSQFVAGAVSFAGSDSYMSDDEGELTAAVERCGGEDIIEVPAYVSSIAIAFNVPGVDTLNLTADVIAQIFDGKITKWNDAAIADLNADADLPDTDITPVHRSDDSGTTKNFTDYLGKVAPDAWPYEAEDAFPVSGGEGAEGTSGVVELITSTEGAIGYADASQTGDLSAVSVAVGDSFVAPSPEAAAATVAVSEPVADRAETDMAVDVNRTTDDPSAYPVILLSYIIACQHYEDAAEEANVKGYLSYIVSEEGQAESADYAGSAPLTDETAARAQEIVAGIGG